MDGVQTANATAMHATAVDDDSATLAAAADHLRILLGDAQHEARGKTWEISRHAAQGKFIRDMVFCNRHQGYGVGTDPTSGMRTLWKCKLFVPSACMTHAWH